MKLTPTPPTVRTNLSYGDDFTAQFRGIVSGYPVDAHCVGEAGCDNAVVWHADFHGCVEELLCDSHLREWSEKVAARILLFDSVVCDGCQRTFVEVGAVVNIRPI